MAKPKSAVAWRDDPARVRPMLATVTTDPPDRDLQNPAFVYEPKYDGIRALVALEPGQPLPAVRIWSRLGNDKTNQFPEVVKGLKDFAKRLRVPVVLDGEIVALDHRGEPTGFQQLQGRMHLTGAGDIDREAKLQKAAIIVFDMLREGADDLRPLPLADRRARLERLFGASGSSIVRHGEFAAGDGRRLFRQAQAEGWEGLVAKRAESPYESGRRSPNWRKLKLQHQEELIIGGWTEPRDTRQHFGALLLGAYQPGTHRLRYVGHAGTGFTEKELARVHALLEAREIDACPFAMKPPSNEKPHWARPELVAQVRFTEWTNEGLLRHPVYLGLRDDVDPKTIALVPGKTSRRPVDNAATGVADSGPGLGQVPNTAGVVRSGSAPKPARKRPAPPTRAKGSRSENVGTPRRRDPALDALADRLTELEQAKRDATLTLPDGSKLDVTNLAKTFWPTAGLTKGDLLRYYVRVSPWLLPAVADRPLVMKRLPNGIKGKAFYQQRAPDDVPPGVRVDRLADDGEPDGSMPRLVGGTLQTLLYMTQLAAISQDPWFSRVQAPEIADYVALDLDPMPGVGFRQVLDVTRWLRDDLERLGVPAVPKTSGSSGLHVYIPLPPETPYESGLLLCQIFATLVSMKHPKQATVERAVGKRGRTVYVDYLQNILGKTLATAYSARASEFAGVSTPLTWDEVEAGVEPEDFTVKTVVPRFEQMPDLWTPVVAGPPVDLHGVLERLASAESA